jgi:uncharacterized protein (TIGR03437 family)
VTFASRPAALVAADLNGDGRADLVMSNCRARLEKGLGVALSDPNAGPGGGFAPVSYIADEGGDLVVGDLNGDGKTDILTSSGSLVLINKGDGGFASPVRLNVIGQPALGDVNGDGTNDIVVFRNLGDNGAIFALPNTTRCLPPNGIVAASAASYASSQLAGDSIAALFGADLTAETKAATGLPLPTTLSGLSVIVKDSANAERPAPLFFASPGQINFQVPPGAAAGVALIELIKGGGAIATSTARIAPVLPGLFSADATGAGYPAATVLRIKADGAQLYEPVVDFSASLNRYVARPVDLGPDLGNASDQVFLILFGTGVRNRSALSAVAAQVGGAGVDALYAGAQGGFVGLDQVNLRLPRSLAGRGEINVSLVIDGKASNVVRISIK